MHVVTEVRGYARGLCRAPAPFEIRAASIRVVIVVAAVKGERRPLRRVCGVVEGFEGVTEGVVKHTPAQRSLRSDRITRDEVHTLLVPVRPRPVARSHPVLTGVGTQVASRIRRIELLAVLPVVAQGKLIVVVGRVTDLVGDNRSSIAFHSWPDAVLGRDWVEIGREAIAVGPGVVRRGVGVAVAGLATESEARGILVAVEAIVRFGR